MATLRLSWRMRRLFGADVKYVVASATTATRTTLTRE
jgi:hypothetical protein